MITKITKYKEIPKEFRQFVYDHPNGNFFQSDEAFLLFENASFYEPFLLIANESNEIIGSLLFVIIKEGNGLTGFFTKRCVVWGGPLVYNEKDNINNLLLSAFVNFTKKKAIYTEFRNLFDLNHIKYLFNKYDLNYKEHLNFIVSIPSLNEGKARISKSKKRQINKSINAGAVIAEATSIEQVEDFYQILKELYVTKIKKPLADFEFFRLFFLQKNAGKYLLVKYNNRIIGGIMCPIYNKTIYEWYICGLDGEFEDIYPSVLATWAPIEYAANNGLKYFDFMGAGKPDEDYGVREFKSKFGGESVEYGRYERVNNKLLYFIGKMGLGFYKRINRISR